jgi:peptidoglycan/LPS O-acetylase OafA/YrhL
MDKLDRLKALDGLRALAILIVVFSHLGWDLNGTIGVQVFFVISGYLICLQILMEIQTHQNFGYRNFFIRRFARIAPTLLLVVLATCLLFSLLKVPFSEWWLGPLGALTFSMNFIQVFLGDANVSTGFQFTWSLSVEEQFYLICPFLLCKFKKFHSEFRFLQVLISLGILICFFLTFVLTGSDFQQKFPDVYLGLASPDSVAGLLMGCLIAIHQISGFRLGVIFYTRTFQFLSFLALLVVGICAFKISIYGVYFPYITSSLCTAMVIASIISKRESVLTRILSIRILVYVGTISYTLYMTHLLITRIVQNLTSINQSSATVRIIEITSIFITAGLIYKYFERPARKFFYSYQR